MRNVRATLAAGVLGITALGAAACNDDGGGAAASAPATSPATSPAASSTAPAASSSPGFPTLAPTPRRKPKVTGSQVIMIDPSGKKYTRKEMIQLAAGMSAVNEKNGLPKDFCDRSYAQGVKGGGKFPAGRLAFLEACQEGLRLEHVYRPRG